MAIGALILGVLIVLGVLAFYVKASPKFFGREAVPKPPGPGARPASLVREATARGSVAPRPARVDLLGRDGEGSELGLWFGATSGEVFGSADAGRSWATVAPRLAPVTSVRVS